MEPDVKKYATFYYVDPSLDKHLVIKRYSDILLELCPDIIHCWTMRQCSIINSLSKEVIQNRVYICGAVNSCYTYPEGSNHKKILDTCIEKADIIISNSKAGLIAKRIPQRKAWVITNGYDFEDNSPFDSNPNRLFSYELKHNQICVLMACRICPEKDINMYIELAKRFQEDKRFVFILAGDGPSCTDLFLKNIYSYNNLIYVGFQGDIRTYVNIADICVLFSNPPHQEGISNFIMESMAQGKVVIATCGGGTNEIISHGKNGILVEPHDINNACYYLREFADNRHGFKDIECNALATIKEDFNLKDKIQEYITLYEKLIYEKYK